MNEKQKRAAESLRKALIRCGKAGLSGGVYDGTFCIWPASRTEEQHPAESKGCFFAAVEEDGELLRQYDMILDGGAGN